MLICGLGMLLERDGPCQAGVIRPWKASYAIGSLTLYQEESGLFTNATHYSNLQLVWLLMEILKGIISASSVTAVLL